MITHQDDRERDDREHGDRGTQARLSAESFEGFFGRYWPWLNRILISQASDSATAEDVALVTFESAWGHWDDLLTYDRPDSWLYKVAIRRLRRLESKARDRGSLAEDPAGNEECRAGTPIRQERAGPAQRHRPGSCPMRIMRIRTRLPPGPGPRRDLFPWTTMSWFQNRLSAHPRRHGLAPAPS